MKNFEFEARKEFLMYFATKCQIKTEIFGRKISKNEVQNAQKSLMNGKNFGTTIVYEGAGVPRPPLMQSTSPPGNEWSPKFYKGVPQNNTFESYKKTILDVRSNARQINIKDKSDKSYLDVFGQVH